MGKLFIARDTVGFRDNRRHLDMDEHREMISSFFLKVMD